MKKVLVMLSSFNGEKYIKEQILSILNQSNVEITLMIRDDGSTDKTVEVIKEFKEQVIFYKGENLGYTRSFLKMLKFENINNYDYFMFSDQDDFWLPNKVEQGLKKITNKDSIPVLYFSSLISTDENLNIMKIKKYKRRDTTLTGNIIRYSAAGCTFIMNRYLVSEINKIEFGSEFSSYGHDQIIMLLNNLITGLTIYDENSYIMFRRHGKNTSDNGKGFNYRIKTEFNTYFSNRRSNLIVLLYKMIDKDKINYENIKLVNRIIRYRKNIYYRITLAFSPFFRTSRISINILKTLSILLGGF